MPDETFQVGEIAQFQNLPTPFHVFNGDECEVISPCEMTPIEDIHGAFGFALVHQVKHRGCVVAVKPFSLKKRPAKGADDGEFSATNLGKMVQELLKEPATV